MMTIRAASPSALIERRSIAVLAVVSGLMALAIVLGGGARQGYVSDVILQGFGALGFVTILATAVWSPGKVERTAPSGSTLAVILVGLVAFLPLIQLIPVPAQIWQLSDGKGLTARSMELAGEGSSWRPLTVDALSTSVGLLSALVPVAIVIGVSALTYRQRRLVSLTLIGVGGVAAIVGLLQVAQGANSAFNWFAHNTHGEATGFFANRNHFAAMLYGLIVLTAAWLVHAASNARSFTSAKRGGGLDLLPLAIAFVMLVLFIAALVMARSRAGLGLMIVGLMGVMMLVVSDKRSTQGLSPGYVIGAVAVVALTVSSQYAMYRIMQRFAADPVEDARWTIFSTTWSALRDTLPFGSGLGTFVPVYQIYESPETAFLGLYANRAHNDFLEYGLELGVFAFAVIAIYLIWYVFRTARVWQRGVSGGGELDTLLARAATIVIALLLVHALVDYALRTTAVMSLFAFCSALLLPAPQTGPADAEPSVHRETSRPRHVAPAPSRPVGVAPRRQEDVADERPGASTGEPQQMAPRQSLSTPSLANSSQSDAVNPLAPPQPGAKWTSDVEWPEAWRAPDKK